MRAALAVVLSTASLAPVYIAEAPVARAATPWTVDSQAEWQAGVLSQVSAPGDHLELSHSAHQFTKITPPSGASLYALDMVTATDGWIGGLTGLIWHWDGVSWTAHADSGTATTNNIEAIEMLSPAEGWAACGGVGGADILRYDGQDWTAVTCPTTQWLYDVDMTTASDGWIVGAGGTILRYDGANWSTQSSPTTSTLASVNMLSPTDGWAVGAGGTILRYDGSTWSEHADSGLVTTSYLYGVDMLSATEGWAVGSNGTILKYDGVNWTVETTGVFNWIYAIEMQSSTHGWAGGVSGYIYEYNGVEWAQVASPVTNSVRWLDSLPNGETWLCGSGSGDIAQYTAEVHANSGTATHVFDAGQTAEWVSHDYLAEQSTATSYPVTPDAADNSTQTRIGTWLLVKTLNVDVTGAGSLRVASNLSTDKAGKASESRVMIGGITKAYHTTDSETYVDYSDEIPLNGLSGTISVELWLQNNNGRTASNSVFEAYASHEETVTSTSFRWATSDNGTDWSSWETSFGVLASSRYLKQEASLATSSTAYTPVLGSTTATYDLPTPLVTQRSYRFRNDDGVSIGSSTDQAAPGVARTDVRLGERLEVRIQLDNTGAAASAGAYKLQYDKSDDSWTDVGPLAEIRPSDGRGGYGGEALTSAVCAANTCDWVDGSWQEGDYSTVDAALGVGEYTELGFLVETGSAVPGTTYRMRLFDTTAGLPLDAYDNHPTFTVVGEAGDTLRYSKDAGALSADSTDLRFFLDQAGYTAVDSSDDVRESVVAWGNTEQRLNVMTTEAQQSPKAATDPVTGRTLVVWEENRGGVYGVYARMLDRDGRPIESADTTVCSATGTQPFPSVALDSLHHRFLITWTDYRNSRSDIFARFVGFDGTPSGADFAVSIDAVAKQDPAVAYDSNADRFLVGWAQWGASGYDVWCRLVDDDGTLLGAGPLEVCAAASWQNELSIAFSPTDDRYLLAWTDYRSGSNYDVYGRLVSADGTLYGASDITVSAQVENQQRPAVSCDTVNGRFLVAWEDSRAGFGLYDIWARLLNGDGTSFGSDFAVCGLTNAQTYAAAEFDPVNQRFLLAWADARSGTNEIYGRLVAADGSLYGSSDTTICVASMNQWKPAVTYDARAGRFVTVWEDYRGSTYDIYSRFVAVDGALFSASPMFLFVEENTSGTHDPVTVCWEGQSTVAAGSSPIYLQAFDRGGLSWTTLASNSTATSGTDLELVGQLTTGLSDYYDADDRITFRVWQAAGDETLQTDRMLTLFGSPITQTSFRFVNDDGDAIGDDTAQIPADTVRSSVKLGERIDVRIQLENTAELGAAVPLKLQFDRNDDSWADVTMATEIRTAPGLSGENGDPVHSPVCAASALAWCDGEWSEQSSQSSTVTIPSGSYTELGFIVDTGDAVEGTTYRLRLVDSGGNLLSSYDAYPTLTVVDAASNTMRHSKEASEALGSGVADADHFLDDAGYAAVAADDGVRDSISAGGVSERAVNASLPLNQSRPRLAYNPYSGRTLVVWQDNRNGSDDIYGRLLGSDGTLYGASDILICGATANQQGPRVAADPTTGHFLVSWTDYRADASGDIMARALDGDGTLLGSQDTSVCVMASNQFGPSLVCDPETGLFWVVWYDFRLGNYNIYGKRVDSSGAIVGGEIAVCTQGSSQSVPSIAYDGNNGRFLVVWADYRTGSADVYGRVVNRDGTLLGTSESAICTATGQQNNPSLAFDPVTSRYLVAWDDSRTNDIVGRIVQADCALYGSSETSIGVSASAQYGNQVAYDPTGARFLTAWYEARSLNFNIYAQLVDSDGTLPAPESQICTATGTQMNPALGFDTRRGLYTAAWDDARSGNTDVYQRYTTSAVGTPLAPGPVCVFKSSNSNNTDSIRLVWDGQSTLAPSAETVYLQVYDNDAVSWATVASNSSAVAGTDFQLSALLDGVTARYYDASNRVVYRVYQGAGSQTFSTDLAAAYFGAEVVQRSYVFQNDDGASPGTATQQALPDTPLTGVRRGERMAVRFQLDNAGSTNDPTVYKLQYDKGDDNWVDVSTASEIRPSDALSAASGTAIDSALCMPNTMTWSDGAWYEGVPVSQAVSIPGGGFTEVAFVLQTSSAVADTTYRLRLYDTTADAPLGEYATYPAMTMRAAADDTERYSKESTSAVPSSDANLKHYLDDAGYLAVQADDGVVDPMPADGTSPVFIFKAEAPSNAIPLRITWDGRSTVAPATNPVYLQVYDLFFASWITVDSNTTAAADTDFMLAAELGGADVFRYWGFGTYTARWRVYQAAGVETLMTDLARTEIGGFATQASSRFMNDDGETPDDSTPSAAADADRTDVRRGERLDVRIQLENATDVSALALYRLQFDRNDDVWTDVTSSSEIRLTEGLLGLPGAAITTPVSATNAKTWMNGVWLSTTGQTGLITLGADAYTELGIMIDTGDAVAGQTYRLRLYDTAAQRALQAYAGYPTLTIVSTVDDVYRFSKDSTAALSADDGDLESFLDDRGYSDVALDDDVYDAIITRGNTEFQAHSVSAVAQQGSSIAYDPNRGIYLAVWGDARSGSGDIYGRFVTSDGRLLGSTDITICADAAAQSAPSVAYDPTYQRFFVAWEDQRAGNSDIYARFLNSDGSLYGTADLAVVTNASAQSAPAVAYDSTNYRFLVVWQDSRVDNDIYGSIYASSTGNVYVSGFAISTAANLQEKPAVAFQQGNSRYLVVWQDTRNGNSDVYGSILNAGTGAAIVSDIAVSTNAATQSEVAVAYDQVSLNYLVAWQDDRNANDDIYARTVTWTGAFPASEFGVSLAGSAQAKPSVAGDTVNNRYLVFWQDERSGAARAYVRPVNSNSTLAGAGDVEISGSSGGEVNVAAAFDTTLGRALVAWDDSRADQDIYGRVVTADGTAVQARPAYLFGVRNVNSTDSMHISWRGKTSVSAASSPVTLEVYDCTGGSWTTLHTENTADANTEFAITYDVPQAAAGDYYDADNTVRVRVAQGSVDATLSTDQIVLGFGSAPDAPSSLAQYESDGVTPISVGSSTQSGSDTEIHLEFDMSSSNPTDILTPMVEIRPVGIDFTGVPTDIGTAVSSIGAPVQGTVSVSGLTPGVSYHWQAWVVGTYGTGEAASFGANPETAADFTCATDLSALITSPEDGSVVSGIVDISGIASGLDFANYEVAYARGTNPKESSFTVFRTSTTPVVNGTLATWNTSSLKNKYTLRLRVYDGSGGSQTYSIIVDVTEPVTITEDAAARATAWGNQHKLMRDSNGTLHAFYVDSSGAVLWTKSLDSGVTWSTEATLTTSGDEVTAAIASNDDVHIAYHSTSGSTLGIVYRKAVYAAGSWTLSGEVPLETSGVNHRNPSLVLDQNGLPHVVWGLGTIQGTKEAAIYYRRAVGDPAVLANWTARTMISSLAAEYMGNPAGDRYVGAALLRDSATNDLYVIYNVDVAQNRRVCVNKATYSGGTWTWGTYYVSDSDCDWPPSAVIVGSNIHVVLRDGGDVDYVRIPLAAWNNDASWSSYRLSGKGLARSTASVMCDQLGNIYAFYAMTSESAGNIGYRILRAGAAYNAWDPEIARTGDKLGNSHPNVAPSSAYGRIEWVWTNGTTTPYTVLYDYIGLLPQNPQALTQFENDHATEIGVGGLTTGGVVHSLYLDMRMRSNSSQDLLTPMVEMRPIGTPFTGVATHMGEPTTYAGVDVTGTVEVTGLTPGTSYHWQAWIAGDYGDSDVVSFGANVEDDADLSVVQGLSLAVDSTYNLDGTDGGGAVSFGTVSPAGSPYLVHADADKHAIGLTVDSNVTWSLSVQASGDFASGGDTIPVGRLAWRRHATSDAWVPFQSASAYSMLSAQAPAAFLTTRYDYQLSITMDDVPGSYTTTLTYTLVAD